VYMFHKILVPCRPHGHMAVETGDSDIELIEGGW
jgi:hypothetical protein